MDNHSTCPQCHMGGSKATWPFCSEYCEDRYYENAPIELIDKMHKNTLTKKIIEKYRPALERLAKE